MDALGHGFLVHAVSPLSNYYEAWWHRYQRLPRGVGLDPHDLGRAVEHELEHERDCDDLVARGQVCHSPRRWA